MDAGTLPMSKEKFISYLGEIRGFITDEQYDKLNGMISELPDDLHLVHGDFHMKNIMVVDGELMIIDMDTISTGQPIFDLAALYVTYISFPEDDPGNLTRFFGITDECGERIWQKLIEYYFDTADEQRISEINDKIRLLAAVRFLYMLITTGLKDGELGQKRIKHSQEHIAELTVKVCDLNI